ncbi:hypothetical protein PBI_COUNT_66 [Microbacterium phage Count]|nr:hypothetical protein PBI_COUNT_66 [Microbacterium phage Count]
MTLANVAYDFEQDRREWFMDDRGYIHAEEVDTPIFNALVQKHNEELDRQVEEIEESETHMRTTHIQLAIVEPAEPPFYIRALNYVKGSFAEVRDAFAKLFY